MYIIADVWVYTLKFIAALLYSFSFTKFSRHLTKYICSEIIGTWRVEWIALQSLVQIE